MSALPETAPSRSVAIISSRETLPTLDGCVRAALAAAGPHPVVIDLLINGNPALAHAAAAHARAWETPESRVKVWLIRQGDKAHAWNEYVHRIWTPGTTAFFLDAYAEPRSDAFIHLEQALARPDAVAASGVPSCGRSARALREAMIREGGFHGNMHALSASTMARLRAMGFRLPLGLYRTDSMIGAVLRFNFDPANNRWYQHRIAVAAEATWDVHDNETLNLKNVLGQFKRRLRQARGQIENRAMREHLAVRRMAPQLMPRTVHELVHWWLKEQRHEARMLFLRDPLSFYAVRQFREVRDWSAAEVAPECLAVAGADAVAAS